MELCSHPRVRIIECLIDDFKEVVKNSNVWAGYTYIKQTIGQKDKETGKLNYISARVNHVYRGACSFMRVGLSGPNKKLDVISEWAYSIFDETIPLDGGSYDICDQTEYNEEWYYDYSMVDEMFEFGGMNYITYEDAYMYEANLRRKAVVELVTTGKFTFTSEEFEEWSYMRFVEDLCEYVGEEEAEYDEDEEDCECHFDSNPTTESERDYLYTSLNYMYNPAPKKIAKREEKYRKNTWFPVFMRSFCLITFPFIIGSFILIPEYVIFDYTDKYVWREGYITDDIIQEFDAIMEEYKEYGEYGGYFYIAAWIIGIYGVLFIGCSI